MSMADEAQKVQQMSVLSRTVIDGLRTRATKTIDVCSASADLHALLLNKAHIDTIAALKKV